MCCGAKLGDFPDGIPVNMLFSILNVASRTGLLHMLILV
jgi:hypothetical protein